MIAIKLLVIDNDPLILESLKVMLSQEKDIIILGLVHDLIEALDICAENEPDVLFMDVHTNNVNGIKLFKAYYPHMKIILLIDFATCSKTKMQVMSLGADGYITKADEIAVFIEKLRKMVLDGVVDNCRIISKDQRI